MILIPNKDRKEWKELLTTNRGIKLNSFFLNIKVEQIKNQIKDASISIETGIDELHNNFTELNKTRDLSSDLEKIFGKLITENQPKQKITKQKKVIDNKKTTESSELKSNKKEILNKEEKIIIKKPIKKELIKEDISSKIKRIKKEGEERIQALTKAKEQNSSLSINKETKTDKQKETSTNKEDEKGKIIDLEVKKEDNIKTTLEKSTKSILKNKKGGFFNKIFN